MNTSVFPPSPNPTENVRFGLRAALAGAGLVLGLLWFYQDSAKQALLVLIGLGLGASLFYASFGFAGSYRAAIVRRDMSGVMAQIVMIGVATVLFAPLLANGEASGAWAPVGVQVMIGAFIFGIGMQLGGACASGTLFNMGGGSLRMVVALMFFCIGAFLGSLHLDWWSKLPNWGTVSLGHRLGWMEAVVLQLFIFGVIYLALRKISKGFEQSSAKSLLIVAVMLALLNFATLLVAGHPWTITWAFTLWGAKGMSLIGWDPSTSGFWSASFQSNALNNSVLEDTTSLMNMTLVVGAFGAAFVSNKFSWKAFPHWRSFAGAVIGGLMMGYGARLAYGCNIGALFSGMASTSLHGWVWIVFALAGTWIGIRLRPLFGLKV